MDCNKCGEKVEEGSLCPDKCGNKQDELINNKTKSVKRKGSLKIILGIIIAVIILISISLILFNKLNKAKTIHGNTVGNINNGGIAAIQND